MASAARASSRQQVRWPYFAVQRTFLYAGLVTFVAAFLPWILILGQSMGAAPMARAWTLWAGLMILAGAMAKWRPLVISSGILGGGSAVFLAVWQTAKVVTVCLSWQCLPGPGVGLLLFAGGAAAYQGFVLLKSRAL